VLGLLARGRNQAHVTQQFPLEQVASAYALLEQRTVNGRLALAP
jgi:hypothetical protein